MSLPSLDYYDELYRKRKANKPVASFDPLDAQLRQERDREIREGLFLSASPDTIARVNKVSRVTGEPPVLVEDRVDAYEKSITSDRFMGVVQEHPSIAKWAVNNPRGAAAAVDDSLSLAKFGKAFKDLQEDFLKDDGWLEQSGDFITRRVRGIQAGFDRFAVATDDFFEGLTPDAQKSAAAKASAPVRREKFKKRAELNEAIQASPIRNEVDWQSVKKNPTVGNIATFIRQQGASSIPDMILAVASLPVYTAGRSGEIGQERAKNSGRTEATIGDVAVASPAALLSGYLDRLGVERLILPGADTVAKRIVKATAIEAGTEFAQEVIEYGGATIGTDVAFNPGEALDRGLAGAVGGAGMAAPIRTGIETPRIIEAVAPVVSKLLQSGNAKKEALFLDNVMKASEKSKLRERDPEAFKDMLRGMAEENGAANVYVSGEALQEYMQSDAYDPDGPLASWVNQVEEAAATGGDVLMPIEEAAVALQPAWATLKDDVRLSAGGVSRREAQTFDEAMVDVMDELERSMTEQEQANAKKLEPIEKLATSINQKLQNAGFTPSTAKIQADLLVQRYATRAERLGKQLTGNEFDVTVNNVLPEGLAAARNADNLDLVINSYFTMKNPKAQTGKSLIEWIAERGGITDDGGDLKSMGLDKWHVGKFKKKALKASNKKQGNMLGVSDSNYQPDRVLVSAIEEGYFPELDGSTELVDANILLEAIGEELRGVPRYAQERIVDDVQQLAMQLDEFLGQAGFDTQNMTRDEMRAAIMQAQDAQLGGYTQATITIDGVERPTTNSNGQPLAQTEEGLRNFWNWFGDSKVVDAEGRPLVVYHGTNQPIEQFSTDRLGMSTRSESANYGFFFTSDPYVAGLYANASASKIAPSVDDFERQSAELQAKVERLEKQAIKNGDWDAYEAAMLEWETLEIETMRADDSGQNIIPAYIAISDPVVLDFEGEGILKMDGGFGDAIKAARDSGSGGLFLKNIDDTPGESKVSDHYVAFSPTQIKSVNNRGTFDPADARILYQAYGNAPDNLLGFTSDPSRQKEYGNNNYTYVQPVSVTIAGETFTDEIEGLNAAHAMERARRNWPAADSVEPDGEGRRVLKQSYEDNARGKITFNSGQATIDLFKTRNLSTFLHEVGHLWLEELRFDASLPDAPDGLKADWEVVNKWFSSQGYGSTDGNITTEAHEMWARGVERYLMEGKSPVPALKRIFETFRVWLTSIYKTVDALKSPITPEIRQVMDRLIATDDQLNDMVERQGIEALFKDAADAGMTGAEFAAYVGQTQGARNEATGKLLDKTMRSIRAREQKRYKEIEAGVREEVSAEVDARPMYKALRLLKNGPMDDAWVRSEFGEDSVRLLPSRVPPVYKTGGIHPDIIAEQSGFDTGKQMVEALMGAEIAHRQAKEGGDERSMRERTISNEVDAIMQDRYGDPLNDGSIEREALEAVHNDMQGDVIAAEIRVLARRSGKRPTPYAIAKDWARNKIRAGSVVDEASPSAIQRYARAAAKSANLAQEAMLKQDIDGAFKHKQAQMLNNALVSEAKAALDDVSGAVKRLEKIAKRRTMKSVDQEYLEQAQALLENVDMRRRSQVGITRQGKFEAWANERQAEGHDVPVPPSFEATLGRTKWTRLSVDNLMGLDEAVKHIIHLGRFKQTLLDNQERREFNELVDEAVQGAGNLRQKPPSDLMAPSYWDGVKSKILAADAALLKMETVFDWLDGGNSNGVFNRVVFRPIADAQENERKMLEETIGNLTDALSAVPNETLKRWGDKVETSLINRETGRPFVFTRDQLVSIALNVGNQSNLDKLTGGYNWQEGEVMSVLANELTQEEWTYVQSVWDTIESLWPQIEAMEKRINGVAPDKIIAQPVETPFGTLKGGYFPVVYDPRRNYDAEANAAKNSNIFEAIYTRASTPKGFTKERTAVERPIHLSLGIINRHVSEVIHDLTHREAIMQADKFLSNKRIMKAVDDTMGPEVRKLFRPWLQRIANEWAYDRAGNAGMEGFIKKLRLNTTIVGMGFRASTILMQAAGYSNSFERVGARWVAPRLKDVANPEAWRFVLENSKEVAARMESLDRDMRDNVKSAMGKTDWLTAPKRFAFHGIAYMDRVVVVPTWLGAYDKAIAGGMTEEDAIYAADKAVRQSQGSGAAKDLAAVQTGRGPAGEALKLLTMFYSYMSAFYQRQRNLGRDVRNASASDIPALMARAWWLLIVPPVLAELLAGRGPEDDEDWAAWSFEKIAFTTLGPIPLVRDVAPVAYAKATDDKTFGYRFTPAAGAMESVTAIAGDAGNVIEGEETKRATRNAIETVGYFTGLTTGQMATAAQFLVDVSYEEQDPETLAQWYEGLTTGKIKEEE